MHQIGAIKYVLCPHFSNESGKILHINNELHTAEDDLHAPDMDSFDINQFLLCMKQT